MKFFKKYHSIENSYREKEINKIIQNIPKDIQWVCTEKVHGANFSFITDGVEIRMAKRTCLIGDDGFYDSKLMYEKYSNKILELFFELKKLKLDLKFIQVYAEHFGGSYKGLRGESKKIQSGVYYIPFTDIMVYDILLVYETYDEFLNWDLLKKYTSQFKIKHVPEIYRGTFDECLNYKNDYITKVPSYYGLEELEDNICEGNVIKPIEDIRIGKLKERPILKNKNSKFKEKGKVKRKNKDIIITDDQRKWVDEITKYFEYSRLNNLFSKGEVEKDWKIFGKISGLFFKDAYDDFIKDNPQFLDEDKKIQKYIKNLAMHEAMYYVREILKKEI